MIRTPFANVLPPLTGEEMDALRASIQADGIRDACVATEDGRLLDGYHRLLICPDAPIRSIAGSGSWSDEFCRAWIIRNAEGRRCVTAEAQVKIREEKKRLAVWFREQGESQEAIGQLLGVARQTVCDWLTTIAGSGNGYEKQDKRRKIPRSEWARIHYLSSG